MAEKNYVVIDGEKLEVLDLSQGEFVQLGEENQNHKSGIAPAMIEFPCACGRAITISSNDYEHQFTHFTVNKSCDVCHRNYYMQMHVCEQKSAG